MSVDAVIVLANLMDADGILNDESARRAAKAADLFTQTGATALVTCGWAYRPDSDIVIADAFAAHLIRHHGIDPASIVVEPHSRDTVGDAYFTKANLALPRRWRRLLVVTSDYHAARTGEIFDFIYGDDAEVSVVGADIDPAARQGDEAASLAAFRATFQGIRRGDTAAILERMRLSHPFYNGQVHPRI